MPDFIGSPTRIETIGNLPRVVEEYFGVTNSDDTKVSIAHAHSPKGWIGLGQCPDYDEFTVVLKGTLNVEYHGGVAEVGAGQAIHCHRYEWVRYSTPGETGAEYISVCHPAHTRASVHRDM
jgi:ethanolamine utilization protein EutQ (cupin superfamily)